MLNHSILDKNENKILQLKNYILDVILEITRLYMGRMLTIVDGCVSDKEQRKAVKDLVRNNFFDEYHSDNLAEILYKFDQVTGLNLINNNELYRQLFGLPTSLATKENRLKSPLHYHEYFSDEKSDGHPCIGKTKQITAEE